MVKVLYITPNSLFDKGGGAIGANKIYRALKGINNIELNIYSNDNSSEVLINSKKTKIKDLLGRLFLHSNYLYIDFLFKKKLIVKMKPDIIILANSRLGFIAKYMKRKLGNKIKIITHFDNIEIDYCKDYMDKYDGLKKKVMLFLELKSVFKDEKNSVIYSDNILMLTKRDKERVEEIYHCKNNIEFLPVCVEESNLVFNNDESKHLNFVFLGSLWYKPNEKGILWFVENVWKNIKDENVRLIIGGSRPSREVLALNNTYNINVYANFGEVNEIVPKNSVFISPIFDGAGMKVKVAEALANGFSIIATDESLVGYEEILKENKIIMKANNRDEFTKCIYEAIDGSNCFTKEAKELQKKYYSYERAKNILKNLIF